MVGVDSDPTNCMECFEVFINQSDLSDIMKKVYFEDENSRGRPR